MQIISSDRAVRKDSIQGLKDFNQQYLTTQVKKGEQLVSMMPAIIENFNSMGDNLVDLSTKNGALKIKIGDYDKK